jgi:hypothetical protein
MKNSWWWLSLLGIWGCSGEVDPSQGDPNRGPLASGAKLTGFAPVNGMCATFDNRQTYCWGKEGSTHARRAPELDAALLVGPGSQGEICGIDSKGSLSCTTAIDEPRAKKPGVESASQVSVGFFGGCAITDAGQVQCWALENQGLFCDGVGFSRDAWRNLELPSRAVQVDFSDNHGCAVTEDGRLFCFGSNSEGESGPAEDDCVLTPIEVPDIDDARQVALGMAHTCVLRDSGVVTCFGEGDMLGLGPKAPRRGSADVSGLRDVVSLESSRIATCALEKTGSLKCWGTSECGSLGISEDCGFTLVSEPTPVQAGMSFEAVGMADGLTCGLTDANELYCWGFSGWDGHAQGSPVPRRIGF